MYEESSIGDTANPNTAHLPSKFRVYNYLTENLAYPFRQGVFDCCSLGLRESKQVNSEMFYKLVLEQQSLLLKRYLPFPTRCRSELNDVYIFLSLCFTENPKWRITMGTGNQPVKDNGK